MTSLKQVSGCSAGWWILLLVSACGGPERYDAPAPRRAAAVSPVPGEADLPPPDARDQLLTAHHLRWVSGDLERAGAVLQRLASRPGVQREIRARASLQLADIAEVTGDRRRALAHLDDAKEVAGPGHRLSLEADDRRARILTDTPLADVRGPVPGSAPLKHESLAVLARFRRAEKLLASYHRVVVAPRIENINEVLRTKRGGLARAQRAYQRVAAEGGAEARAAALFRMGAIYHHLAEALAFELPQELVPSEAARLRRRFQAESTASLRKSHGFYREAAKVPSGPGVDPWRALAEQEARTLSLVLRSAKRRRPGQSE